MNNIIENKHLDSFYDIENDSVGKFRWSKSKFSIDIKSNNKFLKFYAGREINGTLSFINNKKVLKKINFPGGWNNFNIKLPETIKNQSKIDIEIYPPLKIENEIRDLGLMFRNIEFHNNNTNYELSSKVFKNYKLNHKEYLLGETKLKSIPPYLRITMEVKCNIANKNPCVYCSWDWAKASEKGTPIQSAKFIEYMDKYYSLSSEITDCSYGEPPLNKEFKEIVDLCTKNEKLFRLTSNGWTLSKKIRNSILGKNVYLSVSIDSSTSEGFARYRDDGFNRIIKNLTELCKEKKASNNLPYVSVAFIVMKSNINEIGDYIKLMKKIDVDVVTFRMMYREDYLTKKQQTRAGYKFDYDKEYLSIEKLKEVSSKIKKLANEIDLNVIVDWDNFSAENIVVNNNKPLCSEPWKSFYVLNRGITPCCYGREPIAKWSEKGKNKLSKFLDKVWNGEKLSKMRFELANGNFPKYCVNTKGCPIVKEKLGEN